MTIANTNVIAKVAAVVAGLGLVAMSFASALPARAATVAEIEAQIAALQAQLGGSTTASACTFTRDLTVGSQGADVTCLQTALAAKGYFTVAPTGYFGTVTQAAVAKWQAASGITPAAGYFGPMSRAKFAAMGGSTTGGSTGGSTSTGGLSGGEANLTKFNLRDEDGSGDEGEQGVALATAEFDVEDGDVRVERAELTFDAASSTLEDKPWKYFDTIEVQDANGKKLADVDASDKDEWDETSSNSNVYVLTVTGMDYVVDENDTAKLTFVADINDNIDTDDQAQSFEIYVDTDGIRATDGEGIQQYTGDDADKIDFDFGAQDNGDLTVKSNSDDPDSAILVGDDKDVSEDFEVFVFDIDNKSDADALINDITVGVTTGTGTSAENIIRTATLTVDGDDFDGDIASTSISFDDMDLQVDGNDRVTATLTINLKSNPVQTTMYFTVVGSSGIDAEGVDSGDESDVSGSQTSSTHTVALQGIAVEPVSTSQSVVTPGQNSSATYGTYTIKFDVTAIEDDAYISTSTDSNTAGNEGVAFTIGGNSFTGTSTALLTSTADKSGADFFVVREGDTETFTLTVTLDPSVAGTFEVDLTTVTFNNAADFTGASVLTFDANNEDYQTDPIYIAN